MKDMMVVIKTRPGAGSRVEGGLRLSAAMLGMDHMPVLVFLDEGVECLRPGAFDDARLWDYLKATADLAGVYVLSESLEERGLSIGDLDPRLGLTPVDLGRLAEMVAESDVTLAF